MSIQLNQLFVYTQSTPASLEDFVEFWAARYRDPFEHRYMQNIDRPHSVDGLCELFRWKIGNKFFAHKRPLLNRYFIDRRDEAENLMSELATCECREIARRFLDHFKDGGAVYRIFWLHCWNTRFPIYDQHVHRAMAFIKDNKQMEELPRIIREKQIQHYLDRYLPFFDDFPRMDGRKVDKALWQFGKSLKDVSTKGIAYQTGIP